MVFRLNNPFYITPTIGEIEESYSNDQLLISEGTKTANKEFTAFEKTPKGGTPNAHAPWEEHEKITDESHHKKLGDYHTKMASKHRELWYAHLEKKSAAQKSGSNGPANQGKLDHHRTLMNRHQTQANRHFRKLIALKKAAAGKPATWSKGTVKPWGPGYK